MGHFGLSSDGARTSDVLYDGGGHPLGVWKLRDLNSHIAHTYRTAIFVWSGEVPSTYT